jgi:hypothetical protein
MMELLGSGENALWERSLTSQGSAKMNRKNGLAATRTAKQNL